VQVDSSITWFFQLRWIKARKAEQISGPDVAGIRLIVSEALTICIGFDMCKQARKRVFCIQWISILLHCIMQAFSSYIHVTGLASGHEGRSLWRDVA